MDIGVLRDLSLVLFWTLFFVQIFRNESLTLWPVHSCPGNKSEVEAATIRLNCSDVKESINVYHCLPLSNLSQLVEFCYDARSGLIEAGNCMVLFRDTLNNHQCGHFTSGCPNDYYFPKYMYSYPACLKINTQNTCYVADPNCPNERFLETTSLSSVTATENKSQTVELTTATDNKSHPVKPTMNRNENNPIKYFPIVLGLMFPPISITIALVIFWKLRRYTPNKKDKYKELELLNREQPSLKTDLKTNIPEHSMILVCEVIGSQRSPPVTEIFWTKNNVEIDIPINGGKYVGGSLANPSLQINEVNERDVGVYQCSATNAVGTICSEIIHLESPILRLQGAFSEDNELTISYSFVNEGSPKVHSIKWTKDGNPLDRKTAKYSGGSLEATFLKIHSPSEDDIGEYGCEISSVLGSAKDSLSLKPPALKTDLKPNIPEHSMILVCEVTVSQRSPPVTDIFWTKDGMKIDITMNRGKYIGGSLGDPSLQINEVNQSDVGVYRCCATNAAGTSRSEIINLEHKDLDNKDFWERYHKYLEEGSVEVCPISQIIIVGEHGVGKTTLLYRLQGRSQEEIKTIRSTRGVECHTEKHSFIFTKNQLKMNEKGISSFSPDPEQIYELAAGKKNDAKGSHGGSTPDSLIQPKLSSTKSETAETVNDDSSSSHMEIRQENDQVDNSRQSKQKIQSEHKPEILPFHSKETKHEREQAKNKETKYNKSLLPMLKAKLEENQKLMSRFGNKDDVVLDVLDFAGQGEYYASHQTYVRKDAIFILVVDTSKDVNERLVLPKHKENKTSQFLCDRPGVVFNCWSPKDYFYYWLNTIRMHGGNSERIIFVGTHKNKKRKDFDFDRLLSDTTKEKVMPRKYFKPVITDLLTFDEETKEEIAEIKNEICEIINGENVKECRPAKWLKYMNMLDIIKRNFQIVRIDEILEIIDHFDFGMSDTEIADMFHFFHSSGKIIFFNIDKLQEILILDIQWFIDCFKHIISDRKHVEEDCKIVDDEEKEMLNYFQDKGVLEVSIYNKLLKQKDIPKQYWSTLGEYQSKLGLMFYVTNFKIDESVTIEEGWYVPSINTQEFRPDITEYGREESSQILCFRFRDYLPHDLFGRVIVACLKTGHWHPYDFRLCKAGADFCFRNMTEEEQIYLYTDKGIITVQFIGKHSEKNGQIVRQEIDSIIRHLCQFYASSTKYEVGFLCRKEEGYKESSINHFVSTDKKYCQGCSKRFLQEWEEAELFWREKVNVEHPNSTIGEMDALQIACEVYFHVLKRSTDKTADNIRTLESVDLERNTLWLDNLVDIEQRLKDVHRKTIEASEEKETEIRNINRNLKNVAFSLKDVCRDLRKEIFFLLTQKKNIPKNNHGIPVIALKCTDEIVQIGSSVTLEAETDVEIRDHLWLRKTFQENKYRVLHPDDQEEKFEFKEMDGKRALMIKNFVKQDEGHHYFIVDTDNGLSVCRKTLFSADIIEVFLDKLRKGNLEPLRNNACGIIIGCAGSGKTTLLGRLKGNDLAEIKENTRSTRGLDIRTDVVNLKDTMKEKKITIVDYAGLCVYNATHHIFLSPQTFFVLVLNMEKKFDDKVNEEVCIREGSIFKGWTQRDFLTFWMKSIHQYSSKKVPVILVGTHAEGKSEQEKTAFFREVWKTLTTKYKPSLKHLHIKRQFTVGFDDNENLEQIKQAIDDVMKELDHLGEKNPNSWALFEKFFQQKKSLRIMNRETVLAFNKGLPRGIKLETVEDINVMLQYFHYIRVILYFDQTILREVIILDVIWFVDAFNNIITDKNHAEEELFEFTAELDKFNETGELPENLLSAKWKMNNNGYIEHKDNILLYMEKLGLLAKMSDNKWYVPCMNKIQFPVNYFSSNPASSILCYTFDVVPAGIFHRLVASCMQIPWKIVPERDIPCIYQTVTLFTFQDHNILLGMTPTEIQLQVFVIVGEVDISVCLKVQEKIDSILSVLSSTSRIDLQYSIAFKCKITGFCDSEESSVINESEFTSTIFQCPYCPGDKQHVINTKNITKYWKKSYGILGGRSRFAKLGMATNGVLNQAYRDILEMEVPPSDIENKVKASPVYKRLHPEQEHLLQDAKHSGYKNFDISLTYMLIRNICNKIPKPTKGKWGEEPAPEEITVGDDIERIRSIRNLLTAHVSSATTTQAEFDDIWSAISDICQRLEIFTGEKYLDYLTFFYKLNLKDEDDISAIKEKINKENHDILKKVMSNIQKLMSDIQEFQSDVKNLNSKLKTED